MSTGGTAMDEPTEVAEEALDRLFHGPLEEFTPGRNELAKRLRGEGNGAAADWVKGLKKPTRAAWLVNQLAGREQGAVRKLLDLGEELRSLQEQMLEGSVDRERLRESAKREQRAIDELLKTVEAVGREHGVGSQILDRVAETLQAASSDPDLAVAIGKGRVQREQRATSLGLIGPAGAAPPRGEREQPKEAAERRAEVQLARRRQRAEKKLASAKKRVERERAAVERATEALGVRQDLLRAAQDELAEARRQLEEI